MEETGCKKFLKTVGSVMVLLVKSTAIGYLELFWTIFVNMLMVIYKYVNSSRCYGDNARLYQYIKIVAIGTQSGYRM